MGFSKEKLIAVTLEFPPYNYTNSDTQELTGASTDLIKAIFNDMGYELECRSYPWKRSQHMVKIGKAEIIYTWVRSEERQEYAFYSNPISTLYTIFIKKVGSDVPSEWETLSDFQNYTIGINGGYHYTSVFTNAIKDGVLKKIDVLTTGNPTPKNFKKLLANRIDYYICPSDCIFAINELPEEERKLIEKINHPITEPRTFHIGFTKNKPNWEGEIVRQKFNALFDEYLKQGKVKEIYDKYGLDINYESLGSNQDINWDNTKD